jgi:hypothetical protein
MTTTAILIVGLVPYLAVLIPSFVLLILRCARLQLRWWTLFSLLVPFLLWLGATYGSGRPSSLANLAFEPILIGAASDLALLPVLAIWPVGRGERQFWAAVCLCAAFAVGTGLFFPFLRE